jgi:hypothetical protein
VQSTLTVTTKALREAEAAWWQLTPPASTLRGLYGGKLVQSKNGNGFTLSRYALTPGVFITGKIKFVTIGPPSTYSGTVRISGPAAVGGTLKITKNAVSGRLGGRSVKASY